MEAAGAVIRAGLLKLGCGMLGELLAGLPAEFTAGRYHSLYAPAGEVRGGFDVTAVTPDGVTWPQVSQITMARAPHSIAVLYRRFTVSGSQRVVSSVTYITSRPMDRAYFTADSVVVSRKSSVQSSA